ncbi:MAG: DUF362 domain-containing protein [Acidobacteriota bacterium]|jgi:uncharacterized protein (DUF362 family)|nr:DUF362 domain-containing protein [Acidobacteriota bacterium]
MATETGTNRRQFIHRSLRAGLGAVGATGVGLWLASRSEHPQRVQAAASVRSYEIAVSGATPAHPALVVVSGGEPAQLADRAMKELGGMGRFVSRGDVVVLKPNIGWDRVPQQAANTNPELVKRVAELCFDAGAKKVVVTDVSCNDPRRCFQRSGIQASASKAGATVLLPEEHKFRDFRLGGELLSVWPIYTPMVEADKIINLPIVKHHNLCRATMGLKNWYGLLGGRRNQLHQNIEMGITDLANFIRPTLTILDAYRILVSNGPQGGNLDDVRTMKMLAAGTDPVAIDSFGATLLGIEAGSLQYLNVAEKRGLGKVDFTKLDMRSLKLA